MTENAPAPSPDQRRAEELKNEARRVASTLVVLSGTDCIGIGSYEPAIAAIVQLDADGVNRRARTAEAWRAYIADALIKFAQQHAAAQERADAGLRGEADDMAYRFGCLLDHATGARLSKTNYPKEVMYNAVNEYVQRCCDKAVREAREEWEAARAEAERERDDWRSKAKVRADEADALEARAADAERERDEYREGFHAAHEMYGAAVAIFKEQRRVLGVPEGDGVSIIDHCADLVRRLEVARKALKNADTMLRAARTRLVASGATMNVYDATLAETKEALAALGPAPTPTPTPTPKD